MKKLLVFLLVGLLASCTLVRPNYYGVLMENFGKNGKSDYSIQQGRVSTIAPGTQLFLLPAWEQRAEFINEDGNKRILNIKDASNTAFTASPMYSYKVIKDKAVDVVFQNSQLGSGKDFMSNLEFNVLQPRIYDIIKEEAKKYLTDTLMASGGSLKFEQHVQSIVSQEFEKVGLQLMTFSLTLAFSTKVTEKIDQRNEVNTNVTVIDQRIIEQRKRNELAELEANYNIIRSKGLTDEILTEMAIHRWNGVIYGQTPYFLKNIQ